MNSNSTNKDGWEKTEMRTYLNGDVYSSLSSDLQSVIKTVNKSSDKGKDAGNGAITTTADKLWLFSAQELTGHNKFEGVDCGDDNCDFCGSAYNGTLINHWLNDGTIQYEYYKNMLKEHTAWSKNGPQNSGMFRDDVPSLYKQSNGSFAHWWTRSSRCDYDVFFCDVGPNLGTIVGSNTSQSKHICFGFCI